MQDRVALEGRFTRLCPWSCTSLAGAIRLRCPWLKGKQEWDKRQALREHQRSQAMRAPPPSKAASNGKRRPVRGSVGFSS